MSTVRKALLTLAATTVGLTSGVMFCYQVAVMPGLGLLPDREFVTAFPAIDRSIVNPVFLVGTFLGGAVWFVAATAVHRRERRRFRLLAAASVLYVELGRLVRCGGCGGSRARSVGARPAPGAVSGGRG